MTDTLTAYGFPITRAWRESYLPTYASGRLRFYTLSLEGLEVNRKVYPNVEVDYVISGGQPRVWAYTHSWEESLSESATRKVEAAADDHMRATYAQRFGDSADRREALAIILRSATKDMFEADARRGSLDYMNRIGYPFPNQRSDFSLIAQMVNERLTDAEQDEVVRTEYRRLFAEHIRTFADVLDGL